MVNAMGEVQVESPTVPPRAFRVVSMAAYAVALTCWIAVMGLPRQALPAVAWIWLATIAWNVRAPWRTHLAFLRDWSLPLAVLTLYLYSRGVADDLGIASVHVTAPRCRGSSTTGAVVSVMSEVCRRRPQPVRRTTGSGCDAPVRRRRDPPHRGMLRRDRSWAGGGVTGGATSPSR